jgi:dethiobiotin synthetase
MARPDRLVVIAGTGTEVGKTWVAAAVLSSLRAKGCRVGARKPAQSFEPGDLGRTDAEILGLASGEAPAVVCPSHRWYEVPMAPPMAADALGRPAFTIADLVAETVWADGIGLGLIETAGGVRSPLARDGDTVDLVVAVKADQVVLVADAGLGTLNLVRLCADALAGFPLLVYLNRFDQTSELHRRNRDWILERLGRAIPSTPAELIDALRV